MILIGLAIGALNGLPVTRVGLPSFITTLGMLALLRGAANTVSSGYPIPAKNTDLAFYRIIRADFPDTPVPNLLVAMAVATALVGGPDRGQAVLDGVATGAVILLAAGLDLLVRQTATRAHRERAHVLRRAPVVVAPARRVEAMDLAPLDVDPIQDRRLHLPERPLAEDRLGVEDASDLVHRHPHQRWRFLSSIVR